MKGQHIFLAEGNALKKDFKDAFSLMKRMIDTLRKGFFIAGWVHG